MYVNSQFSEENKETTVTIQQSSQSKEVGFQPRGLDTQNWLFILKTLESKFEAHVYMDFVTHLVSFNDGLTVTTNLFCLLFSLLYPCVWLLQLLFGFLGIKQFLGYIQVQDFLSKKNINFMDIFLKNIFF